MRKSSLKHGYVSDGLRGAEVEFDMRTVTGTENLLLSATLARGTMVLRNCAREPEVIDLASRTMGADIEGAGTHEITVLSCAKLQLCNHRVIAYRIECGTSLIAGGLAGRWSAASDDAHWQAASRSPSRDSD